MSINVIPAYRVIAKSARQAKGLPFDQSVDLIERNLRDYVRNLLSMLHPSFSEIGVRSAVTQLGDPDPEVLVSALEQLEKESPRAIVEDALSVAAEHMPRPDLNSRVFLLPGDGMSRVLTQQMHGVLGFSLGAQAVMVFLWPVEGWQDWLRYTVTHEYAHLVRNLLFPRGLANGRLVYMRTQEPETLLDAIIAEGIADVFATQVISHINPPWTRALNDELEDTLWPRVQRRFKVSDPTEIRRVLFGDNDRIPPWTGYTLGFRIIQRYLKLNSDTTSASLIGMPASVIFEESGYRQGDEQSFRVTERNLGPKADADSDMP